MTEVVGEDCLRAAVEGGVRVGPLGAAVAPLEGVVVELGAQGQAEWEVAETEQDVGSRAGDFVHVADDQHVVGVGLLGRVD